jgi:hypothetical protein
MFERTEQLQRPAAVLRRKQAPGHGGVFAFNKEDDLLFLCYGFLQNMNPLANIVSYTVSASWKET